MANMEFEKYCIENPGDYECDTNCKTKIDAVLADTPFLKIMCPHNTPTCLFDVIDKREGIILKSACFGNQKCVDPIIKATEEKVKAYLVTNPETKPPAG